MGSPLSSFLAEIALTFLEDLIVKFYPLQPSLYFRYVDDVFLVWPYSLQELNNFIFILNKQFSTVKFTFEMETNGKLPFLDLLFYRTEQKTLAFDIFRKSSFLPLPIPASANVPLSYKKSFFSFYFRRALLCTSNKFFEKREIDFIFKLGRQAGFKTRFLNGILKAVVFSVHNPNPSTSSKSKSVKRLPVPFYLPLQKQLNIISKKFNLGFTFRSPPNLLQLLKEDRDKIAPSAGVYKIPLETPDNNTVYYIGQTKRNILNRIKEHQNNLKKEAVNSVLVQRINELDLKPKWQETAIICKPNTCHELKFAETVQILKTGASVINSPTYDINTVWKGILKLRG